MREFLKHGHIFIVCTGLLLFWFPLFSRKGGSFHRKSGLAYAAFMAVAAISGLVLASSHLAVPEKRAGGIFLFYAALLLISFGRHGLAVLKAKSDPARLRTPSARALDFALLGGSWGWLPWLLPLALGGAAISVYRRRYRNGVSADIV